jgi:hypothetical protein
MITPKSLLSFLSEAADSEASQKAKEMGLTSAGYGNWRDRTGNVVAKTVDGQLVMIDAKSDPMARPAAPEEEMPPEEEPVEIPEPDPASVEVLAKSFSGGRWNSIDAGRKRQLTDRARQFLISKAEQEAATAADMEAQAAAQQPPEQTPEEQEMAAQDAAVQQKNAELDLELKAQSVEKGKLEIQQQKDAIKQSKAMDKIAKKAQTGKDPGSMAQRMANDAEYEAQLAKDGEEAILDTQTEPDVPKPKSKALDKTASKAKPVVAAKKEKSEYKINKEIIDTKTQPSTTEEIEDELSPELEAKIGDALSDIFGMGSEMAANNDPLGDELSAATDNIRNAQGQLQKTINKIEARDKKGAVPLEVIASGAEPLYVVTSPGGLGSDRGRYVEQGLTDHVLPAIFGESGRKYYNDGGPRVKTDIRVSVPGGVDERYTVKTTVGNDGLEANNAGFRRFFDMWELDPNSGPGKMFSTLMGIPWDFADQQGFGDGMGEWNDKRDGMAREGSQLIRKMPIQAMYPDVEFTQEELNANSMSPARFRELHPQEFEEGMNWLEENKMEIMRRIMSQRDNDFGEGGAADPSARPNIDYDPEPANRAAWYHLDKSSKGSAKLRGRLEVHDITPEVIAPVIANARWELSDSISGGFSLVADNPNAKGVRGSKIALMKLTRKANKAGGGRYGNGFHSPRFGYNYNSFDLYPHVSSTKVDMDMGSKVEVPEYTKNGKPAKKRDGTTKTKVRDGKIIESSVKVGDTKWSDDFNPMMG